MCEMCNSDCQKRVEVAQSGRKSSEMTQMEGETGWITEDEESVVPVMDSIVGKLG